MGLRGDVFLVLDDDVEKVFYDQRGCKKLELIGGKMYFCKESIRVLFCKRVFVSGGQNYCFKADDEVKKE